MEIVRFKSTPLRSRSAAQRLWLRLEREKLFRFVPPDKIGPLKERLTSSGDFFDEEIGRVMFIDPEVIYESGLKAAFAEHRLVMLNFGIDIEELTEPNGLFSDTFVADYCGKKISIELPLELQNHSSRWYQSTVAALLLINFILKLNEANDRVFFEYGSNDTRVLLATGSMFRAAVEERYVQLIDVSSY